MHMSISISVTRTLFSKYSKSPGMCSYATAMLNLQEFQAQLSRLFHIKNKEKKNSDSVTENPTFSDPAVQNVLKSENLS